MTRLSVVTITFNNFDELLETCNSLKGILFIEHCVINGGSCSKTLNFLTNHPGPSISEKDNGISDAFNKGFKLSTGEFITYLNSGDILISQDYYKDAIEAFASDPELDFVYADICYKDKYAGHIRVRSNNPLPSMPYLHPTLIVRKNIMKKTGLFSREYKIAMDLDFAYRLMSGGFKGLYIPRMVVEMDGEGVSSKNYIRGYSEVIKIILRNRDFSYRSLKFILVRSIAMLAKILLLKLRGDLILTLYRKKRYQIRK